MQRRWPLSDDVHHRHAIGGRRRWGGREGGGGALGDGSDGCHLVLRLPLHLRLLRLPLCAALHPRRLQLLPLAVDGLQQVLSELVCVLLGAVLKRLRHLRSEGFGAVGRPTAVHEQTEEVLQRAKSGEALHLSGGQVEGREGGAEVVGEVEGLHDRVEVAAVAQLGKTHHRTQGGGGRRWHGGVERHSGSCGDEEGGQEGTRSPAVGRRLRPGAARQRCDGGGVRHGGDEVR